MTPSAPTCRECGEHAWCPQCGPGVRIDEDGCCATCGADAVGEGADVAHHAEALGYARGIEAAAKWFREQGYRNASMAMERALARKDG